MADEGLSKEEVARFREILSARKQQLLEEIREGLARAGANERYDQVAGAIGDAGDESVAILTRDLANAEVERDVREVRDIIAAEERIARGQYGYCIECGAFIGLRRLEAYPTAKRCLPHQEMREKTRASIPHSRL